VEALKKKQSRFLYVTNRLFWGATQICIFFIACSVILGIFYYRKINIEGGGGKKIYIWNLISWFFVIYSLVLVLFSSNSKWVKFFGVYNRNQGIVTMSSNEKPPSSIGIHDSVSLNTNDTINSVETANGGVVNNTTSQNNTQSSNTNNNTTNQIETNAQRTAANDVTQNIKNKYLNSTLRIVQNDYFKNKNNKKSTNQTDQQIKENKQINSSESGIIYSKPMTNKDLANYINDTYCIDELENNTSGCINIPFRTLIIVIVLAMIVGILFDIFAIRRIAEKNEIP
jgi:hypothetical protein